MLHISFWNILFVVINMLIDYWIMKKFLFARVVAVIEARENMIKDRFNEAEVKAKEADEKKAEYQEKMKTAHEQADQILAKAHTEADHLQEKRIAEANAEAEQIRKKAMEQIERDQKKAEEETREQIATLAMMAAKKIMEEGHEGVQHQ